jgi:WD40 repeat protein
VQEVDFKDFEATAVSASGSGEVWVGDKKGLIHIYGAENLTQQKALIEKKHNHGISVMANSQDGKLIASGDSYRYIYVFNTETKEEVGCFPYHTSKVIGLNFNRAGTLLLTVGLDLTVGVANLADKTKKVVHRPNEKELTAAVFDNEDRFFTAGYDCSIRLWSR